MPISFTPSDDARDTPSHFVALGLLVVGVMAAMALSFFELRNDDAGFHVATGQWIRAHGEVPLTNPFSYAEDGATWIQHQWVAAVWMSWVVDMGGAKALVLWKTLMVGLCFVVVAFSLLRSSVDCWRSAGILSIAVVASAFRFYARPYLFSVLALVVTVAALLEWQRRPLEKGWMWIAGVTPVVAIHLHAGGLYSLLAWGAFVAAAGFHAWGAPRWGVSALGPELRSVVIAFGGILAAVVVSLMLFAPSGLGVLLLPLRFSGHGYFNDHLVEFRTLALRMELLPAWIAMGMAAFGAIVCVLRRRIFELLLIGGFGFLAFRHTRMVFPMAVVSAMALGSVWVLPNAFRGIRRVVVPAVATALVIGLLGWGWAEQSQRFRMGLGDDGVDESRLPLEMLEKASAMPGEVFVSDGLAGTWLWQHYSEQDASGRTLPPEERRRILIHNCLECYDEKTYIDVYQHIRYGKERWSSFVQQLGIRTFLLKHTSPGEKERQAGQPNLRWHLFQSEDWSLVDFDDQVSIYVRSDSIPQGTQAFPEFPVDPDSWKARRSSYASVAEKMEEYGRIHAALLAHSERHPTQVRSLVILGQYAAMAGDVNTLIEVAKKAVQRQPESLYADQMRDLVLRAVQKP